MAANRRLLNSSHDVATKRSSGFQPRSLLLTLALVSYLISINCASFGHRLDNQHQHADRVQPEYHIYSLPSDFGAKYGREATDPMQLYDHQSGASSGAAGVSHSPAATVETTALNSQQQTIGSQYDNQNSPSTRFSPQEFATVQLFRQLARLRELVEGKDVAEDAEHLPPWQLNGETSNSDEVVSSVATDFSAKEVPPREYQYGKILLSSASPSYDNYYSLAKYTDPKDLNLFLSSDQHPLDSSEAQSIVSDQGQGLQVEEDEASSGKKAEINSLNYEQQPKGKQAASREENEGQQSATSAIGVKDSENGSDGKFSTLLEDEDESELNGNTVTTSAQTKTIDNDNNNHESTRQSSEEPQGQPKPTGEQEAEESASNLAINTGEHTGYLSIFNRFFKKFSSYLPFLDSHKTTGTAQGVSTKVANKGEVTSTKVTNSQVKHSGDNENNQLRGDTERPEKKGANLEPLEAGNEMLINGETKHRFSTPVESNKQSSSLGANSRVSDGEKSEQISKKGNHDKEGKISKEQDSANNLSPDEPNNMDAEMPGTFMDSGSDENEISATSSNSGGFRVVEIDDNDEPKEGYPSFRQSSRSTVNLQRKKLSKDGNLESDDFATGTNQHRVSMLRKSDLIMPFKTNDQLILQSTSIDEQPPASLLGKYIYAPEQHYHLSTLTNKKSDLSPDDDDDDGDFDQMYVQMSQRSYPVRVHSGENFKSFSSPMYDSQGAEEQHLRGLVVNKANDFYFLVMVGAFCAMACTVVVAAGFFAYRVQQSRKSTSEADYPTYGVVGPNNMNGKCGAAAFVGGYFGGIGPGTISPGSAKHLADAYSGSDSGVATSCKSGTNKRALQEQSSNGTNRSSDFLANQNAARMYHYQHQKQQMIISDRTSTGRHTSASDLDSEDENDDGSYTVYECPGLASAHEMEIKNPLFNDDQTP